VKPHSPLDLSTTITTPENIQFEYRIAGPFRRLPALLLDFVIRLGLFFGTIILLSLLGLAIPFTGGLLVLFFLVCWFALDWFYGLAFEFFWNGQTPGKWICKIRVLSSQGQPINAYQATVRNFLRLADFAPMVSFEIFSEDAPPMYWIPTFLVSLISMTVTKRFQRIGDLAAGTMVVVNPKTWVPPKIKLEDRRIESLCEFIPANFRMSATLAKAISLYMERRSRIPVPRRQELAMYIARPLLKQFDFREDTSPDLLLCTLYYRDFVAKEIVPSDEHERSARVHQAPPPRNGVPMASPAPVAALSDSSERIDAPSIAATPPVLSSPVLSPPILASTKAGSELSSQVGDNR
jgi:uncharacterized RDD family membrane protein YckC